ncbi:ATP-binding protein [Thermodesulfobacteriota bacterium]
MDLLCPVTGLRVISRSEWTNKKVSNTFVANFHIIGNSILYSSPAGKADIEGVQNSVALKKEVIKHISDSNGHYIQIQDYAALNGSTQAARSYFTQNANEDKRLLSMIFCNLSPSLSVAVKIGKRFNSAGKIIHVAKHYEDAIKRALEHCDQHNLKQDFLRLDQSICFDSFERTLTPVELISDNAWDIQTPGYSNRSVIIDKCILHSIAEGYLEPMHISLHKRSQALCQAALPEDSTIKYILADGSRVKASRTARIQFMKYLKDWHQQFPFRMYVLYGANIYMRAAANLARPLMPFKIKFAQDFKHGFDIIRQDKLGNSTNRQKKADSLDPNIEKLLAFIGSINWEQEGIDSNVDVGEQHPFYILFQSIKLIKEELDSLFVDRKKAEKTLQSSNTQLQIALSELEQKQETMIRQERLAALGQLAAGIAHDFNNILTSILSSAELMQMSSDTSTAMQSNLKQIIVSSHRAEDLVRQLLDFTRKTIRQPKQFDFASFTKESVNFFKRTISENIQINLNLEPGDYLIEADLTQLQQVITNLTINARDAMPTGGELRIGLSRIVCSDNIHCVLCNQTIEGKWVQLKVTDTGSGISADVLPRIFEPFFTTKEVGAGTGLGLSQISGIVEQHQGHIRVESQVGQGTTFTIYLPVVLSYGEEASKPEPAQIRQGQGETILLVEDDPTVLKVIAAMLERLGYRTITAPNGEKAMAIVEERKTKIALVLSDMMMPDMDGETLFYRLRARNPHLKMVMMSGYPLGERGAKLLELGVVAWFKKPIRLGQLSQVVDKVLSNREGR